MPLPEGDMSWPPQVLGLVLPKMAEWSAWYSGDGDDLARIYSGRATEATAVDRVAARRGGVMGRLARWFWGQPTATGTQRAKLHVPIAADIATASADLLFAEEIRLNTDELSTGAADRLNEVLEAAGWTSVLLEAGEIAAALGGGYLRTTWDTAVADHPIIDVMHADQAWPEFKFGILTAVTFWSTVGVDGQQVWRYLERHDPGRVQYGLYLGSPDRLGRVVPLTESAATADLATVVDADSSQQTGYPGLTAAYLPNMRPNRQWRKDPLGRELGRSDYAGVESLMDAADETWSSWMRDIRLGKGRILVPEYMLEPQGTGGGYAFDLDQEVYAGLNIPPNEQGAGITTQQFAIRTAEHAATLDALQLAILRGAGYSAQTFGLADEGAPTATEVNAKEKRSALTREKKTRYAGMAMEQCLAAVTAVDAWIFHQGEGVQRVKVEFPQVSQPSQVELAQTSQALRAAEAASTYTLVKLNHPDWDEAEVLEEVSKIQAEVGASVPNPATFTGAPTLGPDGQPIPDPFAGP
jgi:A118 family predicted phage portal protein